jgi:transcriptional regulator with XRE-family HTH domain
MSSARQATEDTRSTGRRLRELREAAGLSQNELAHRLGCQQPAIARLEAGEASPNMRTLDRIANALGLELQWQMVSRDQALTHGIPATTRPNPDR